MSTRSPLDRLAAARPAILDDTEPIVTHAEQDDILEHILATPLGAPARPGRPTAPRRHLSRFAVAAGFMAVAILAGYGLIGRSASRPPGRPSASDHASLSLAAYRFRLPAGFKDTDNACKPTSIPPAGTPLTVAQTLAFSASKDGGCLALELAAGSDIVPASATPVAVGTYQGWEVSNASTATLWVAIPPGTDHYLVLYGTQLTTAQLIAIAASGLPNTSDSNPSDTGG